LSEREGIGESLASPLDADSDGGGIRRSLEEPNKGEVSIRSVVVRVFQEGVFEVGHVSGDNEGVNLTSCKGNSDVEGGGICTVVGVAGGIGVRGGGVVSGGIAVSLVD